MNVSKSPASPSNMVSELDVMDDDEFRAEIKHAAVVSPARFLLYRRRDLTGVSGTGIVGEGVAYRDGAASMRWCSHTQPSSTVEFDCWTHIQQFHGHDGSTRVVWIDHPPPPRAAGPHARPHAVEQQRLKAA